MHYDGILYASTLNQDGDNQLLQGDAISQAIKDDKLAWVHLDGNSPATREWLQTEISYLDHIIIDALLAEETRPRVLEINGGVLMILRGVNLNDNANPEDMISIRMWVDQSRIITIGRRPLKAVKDIQIHINSGQGPRNAGDFVADLIARLFDRMDSVFSDLSEHLDDVEEKVAERPDITDRKDITEIRKQAIIFKRYMTPQKGVLTHLRSMELSWVGELHKRRLQESLDRISRYVEDLDAIRERAQIVKDELASTLADQMNKNMYILSVIAAIFLPLGFLTGLLGINVGGIPGADNSQAFTVFCGGLAVIVLAQIALFKKMKWF